MTTPIASATVTVDSLSLQPILTFTCGIGGYMIVRINSGTIGEVELSFSSDGGLNYAKWPDPELTDSATLVAVYAMPAYYFPSRLRRGEKGKVRAQAAAGTAGITVEVYEPSPVVPGLKAGVSLP